MDDNTATSVRATAPHGVCAARMEASCEVVESALAQVSELRQRDHVLADAIEQLAARLQETQKTRVLVVADGLKTTGLDSELLEIRGALRDLCAQAVEGRVRGADATALSPEDAGGSSPIVTPPQSCHTRCAYVPSSTRPGVRHCVTWSTTGDTDSTIVPDSWACTCEWWTKGSGAWDRPCRHVVSQQEEQKQHTEPNSTDASWTTESHDTGYSMATLDGCANTGFPYKVMQDVARVRSRPELDKGSVLGSLRRGNVVHVQEVRRNAGPNGVHRLRFKWSDSEWGWVSQTASNGTELLKPASVAEVQAGNQFATPERRGDASEADEASMRVSQQPQLRQQLLPCRASGLQSDAKPLRELGTEQIQQQVVISAYCRKQKPTMRTWHERHARIQGTGLFFYDSDDLAANQRGSSISDVAGCLIQTGEETFYFPSPATWWTLSLQRDDLMGDGVTACAFRDQSTRDAFATALAGMSAGKSNHGRFQLGLETESLVGTNLQSHAEPEPESEPPLQGITPQRLLYEDLELSGTAIGRGQDKTVYLARYKGNDVAALFAKAGTMLEAEAQIFARAGAHPNLIHFFGLAQHGDLQCLVAERAAFGSLDHFLEDHGKKLVLDAKLQMGSQIAAGMGHLHTQSLIHRDLATRNVLVCQRGDKEGHGALVKLTDFGLTKEGTGAGAYYGSENRDLPVLWMAPEALQRRKFTEKTDIWAFGVTIWECLTDGAYSNQFG